MKHAIHNRPVRIVLVLPSAQRSATQYLGGIQAGPPPLGIASLAGSARAEGAEVLVIEQFFTGWSQHKTLQAVLNFRPDVVGFSCLTPSVPVVKEMGRAIKVQLPDCLILAGNAHASEYPASVLEINAVDAVVHGEGELTLQEILRALRHGTRWQEIPGISRLDASGHLVRTTPRPVIADLNALPRPAWDLFDLNLYFTPPSFLTGRRERILAVQLSRGCPWACTFCAQNFFGKGIVRREPEQVADEVEWLYRRFGVRNFGFVDSVFPLTESDGSGFAEALLRRGLGDGKMNYLITTRVDRIWKPTFKLMARSGLKIAYLGIESANDATLDAIQKKATTDQARVAVRILREVGVNSYGLFMLGLPGDTLSSMRETLQFALELDCDVASFSRMTPYAGSAMDRESSYMADQSNHALADNWIETSNALQPGTNLRIADIAAFQQYAMRRYYLRPKKIYDFVAHGKLSVRDMATGVTGLAINYASAQLQRYGSYVSQRFAF